MASFKRQSSETTPFIDFDGDTGTFVISGNSYWDDVDSVFGPLTEWLKNEYLPNPAAETNLTVRFHYLNTATAKAILSVFSLLESLLVEGKKLEIVWEYNEWDEDLEEQGKDYQTLLKADFKLVPITDGE